MGTVGPGESRTDSKEPLQEELLGAMRASLGRPLQLRGSGFFKWLSALEVPAGVLGYTGLEGPTWMLGGLTKSA